jgi:hypothetical protein
MKRNIFSKIKGKIHRFLGTTIIQFGPPRSGTTLVYNILKDIFPNKSVETRHYYRNKDRKFNTVVTYRNPLDSIASSILRYKLNPSDDVLKEQVLEFEKNGISTVLEVKNNENVLMLKYEDFVNNYENIYNKLEIFFNTNISPHTRNLITSLYNIKATEKIISKMESYNEIDKETLFHGNHINLNKGKPNYYKKILSTEQIIYLKNVYKEYLSVFGYEK